MPVGFSTGFQAGFLATDAGGNAPAVVIDGAQAARCPYWAADQLSCIAVGHLHSWLCIVLSPKSGEKGVATWLPALQAPSLCLPSRRAWRTVGRATRALSSEAPSWAASLWQPTGRFCAAPLLVYACHLLLHIPAWCVHAAASADPLHMRLHLLLCPRCTCNTTLFASGTFQDVRLHTENQDCPELGLHDANTAPCTIPAAVVATVTGAPCDQCPT